MKKLKEIFNMSALQNIDFQDISFENIASWPLFAKRAIASVMSILIVLIGYNFYLNEIQYSIDSFVKKEQTLKKNITKKIAKASNLEMYRAQSNQIKSDFSSLLSQLPNDIKVPNLLEDITRIGLTSGLTFDSIVLQSEINNQFFIELPIKINAKGTYHEISNFISTLAAGSRIVTLHDFKIIPNKRDNNLNLEILAKTYRYKDNKEPLL